MAGKDCIFCKIVRNELPSNKVYEDKGVLAFLDTFPLAEGHTLIVTKRHYQRMEDVPEGDAIELYRAIHKLIRPVCAAVGAPDCNIGVNNGPSGGQVVPHVHAHIIPRRPDDGGGSIHSIMGRVSKIGAERMNEIATKIGEGMQK